MSKPTFTYSPDLGADHSCKPAVHSTKFGDGYEVRVPEGINYLAKKWSPKFTVPQTDAIAIRDFFRECGGYKAFLWKDPLDETDTYVCREWRMHKVGFGLYEVSGDFEQVFEE